MTHNLEEKYFFMQLYNVVQLITNYYYLVIDNLYHKYIKKTC